MTSLFDLPGFGEQAKSWSSVECHGVPTVVDFYKNPLRQAEREYFESIFARLPDGPYKRESHKRFLSQTPAHHLGAWYEWMVYDWLDGLGKTVTLQQSVAKGPRGPSKPDFLVQSSDDLRIFIEVSAVQESAKDQELRGHMGKALTAGFPAGWIPAGTGSYQTMGGRLEHKVGQHPGISGIPGSAYVICLCLESNLIDSNSVITQFLGTDRRTLSGDPHCAFDGIIFERDHKGTVYAKHRDVSALLVASKKRTSVEDGFKLNLELIQNPYAATPIRATEFGQLRRYVVVSKTDTSYYMHWIHR